MTGSSDKGSGVDTTTVEAPQPNPNAQFTLVDALPPGYAAKPAGEPDRKTITFTIDGAQVNAPEGIMLVDAAKYGGVEIPVFCYEPKLGGPVGACRMCLVEIEGIPKLQTACSTPVRDGMSVITRSPRVADAQNSVVEFLLANHPLDCPVCDKGGECPLQDIAFGWGRGESRFTEPKRHFEKPVALSPSIAIDRERCILCYRCVRFSQEVSEDHQLVLLERGSQCYVGTFDGNPYIAPFSGNVIELCPVGALTSQAYRFKARPWDVEQGGSVCTLCPAQCNVSHTVRDEKVMRTLARDNNGVDDGWICDKGRFAHQAWDSDQRVTQPLVRQGDKLLPARWDHAIEVAVAALKKSGAKTVALAGGGTSNEEGWLLRRLMLEAVGSPHIDSRRANKPAAEIAQTLFAPSLTAAVPDIEWADAVLVLDCELVDDMPIIDLRVRKGVRRNGVKLAVASARPSTLDGVAAASARYAPGYAGAFTQALLAALGAPAGGELEDLAARAGSSVEAVQAVAATLAEAQRVVIIWSERLSETAQGGAPLQALCNLAGHLKLPATAGAGLFQVPVHANGRGLREVGVLPHLGPGFTPAQPSGMSSQEMAASDQLGAVILHQVNPVADYPDGAAWEAALKRAPAVIASAAWLDPALERHATVIFPAEVASEKDGTVTHPDGRLQRLRQTVSRSGDVRAGWWVLAELAKQLGLDCGLSVVHQATQQYVQAVAFYAGVTADEIGGTGVRWQDRPAAEQFPGQPRSDFPLELPAAAPQPNGRLQLGTFRSLWSGAEVENADTLKTLATTSRLELSAADGQRLGVVTGDEVALRSDDGDLVARVALRDAVVTGTAFLLDAGDQPRARELRAAPQLVEVVKL